jgi:hypothetical protein
MTTDNDFEDEVTHLTASEVKIVEHDDRKPHRQHRSR